MDIGVLGTGIVGKTLATRLVSLGHTVTMGSRVRGSDASIEWLAMVEDVAASRAAVGTFADATAAGEIVINATAGVASLAALAQVGADVLAGKPLLDVSNPLDFSQGFPPTLAVCNNDSLGEQIQREYPDAHVVKTLNTMNCQVMVDPARVPGEHVVFMCGNNESAKAQTADLLSQFGWPATWIVDLGDIAAARATEMYLPLWLRTMNAIGTADFNIQIVR